MNHVVDCRYFPIGPWLPSQPNSITPLASTKLYCLVTEAHLCEQLAQSRYMKVYIDTVTLNACSRLLQTIQC